MIENNFKRIAIIGGGPAGMMAAGTARNMGASVTIFEQTDRLGKKLAITGKGVYASSFLAIFRFRVERSGTENRKIAPPL